MRSLPLDNLIFEASFRIIHSIPFATVRAEIHENGDVRIQPIAFAPASVILSHFQGEEFIHQGE